jgi:hypothetical protein
MSRPAWKSPWRVRDAERAEHRRVLGDRQRLLQQRLRVLRVIGVGSATAQFCRTVRRLRRSAAGLAWGRGNARQSSSNTSWENSVTWPLKSSLWSK